MLYNQPYGISDPNAPYINGNPSTGTMGSIPPAASIEHPQRELVNIITKSGLVPDASNLNQVAQAIQTGRLIYGVDSGSVNHLIVDLPQQPAALMDGMVIRVLVAFDNTGATNIVVNGVGPKQIVDRNTGADLAAGAVKASGFSELLYGHGVWILLQSITSGGGGGGDISTQVRNVLYPYLTAKNSANCVSPGGQAIVPLQPWALPVGDPAIIGALNRTTGMFTIPVGYDGLWMFHCYANSMTGENTGYTNSRATAVRAYLNGTSQVIAAAHTGTGNTVVHDNVFFMANCVAGNSIQWKAMSDDPGIQLTNFYFTALRLGRST